MRMKICSSGGVTLLCILLSSMSMNLNASMHAKNNATKAASTSIQPSNAPIQKPKPLVAQISEESEEEEDVVDVGGRMMALLAVRFGMEAVDFNTVFYTDREIEEVRRVRGLEPAGIKGVSGRDEGVASAIGSFFAKREENEDVGEDGGLPESKSRGRIKNQRD